MVAAAVLSVCLLLYYNSRTSAQEVFNIWRHNLSSYRKISNILLYLSIAVLSVVLLDPRKEIEKREIEISNQYTIVLIDTSTSMAVEDLRPNRFQKAVMLARHFVKNASGHYISVILFSDGHKIVMPFTDDVDFIDTRLSAIADSAELKGSSNIKQAIQESINYLSAELGRRSDLAGNLVILSDFEEHDSTFDLKFYDKLSVAAIGVASASGGPIPLRDSNKIFRGHKKHDGQVVQSKLSEEGIKRILKNFKNSKYWITMNYNIPTVEILDFFRSNYVKSLDKGNVDLRPLNAKKFWIVGLSLLIVALILRFKPAFIIFLISTVASSSELFDPSEYSRMTHEERLRKSLEIITHEAPDKDEFKKSLKVFGENIDQHANREEKLNYLFGHLKAGDFKNFHQSLEKLNVDAHNDPKLRENILLALKSKSEQQKNGDGEGENDDKSDSDDKQSGNDQSKGDESKENSEKKSDSNKSQSGQRQKDQQENSKQEKNNQEKNEKDKNDKENNSENESQITANKIKQRENEISKKLKQSSMPGILKQLIEDDRKLQSMYLDTSSEKGNDNDQRDW